MSVNTASSRRSKPGGPDSHVNVEAHVRKLIAYARHEGSKIDPAKDDVLFDCEVDGVRCVLARATDDRGELPSLSPREHEVARMIAKGLPNKVIASVLDISVWTVSTHLRRIYAKLGVSSRAAMVARMFKSGKL